LALHYLIDPMQLGKHFAIGTVIASLLFIMGFISDGRLTQRQLSRTLAP
jgi:hypothetical protein